jgi:16S rRNA (adenine1518-N6/adenine1519-N6)-dimethyltransferase
VDRTEGADGGHRGGRDAGADGTWRKSGRGSGDRNGGGGGQVGRSGGDGRVRAKKALGQHFLTDLGVARRIAESLKAEGGVRRALEIGGGMGVLTQFLLERTDIELWGIEIDRESIAYMREHFPDFATGGVDGTGRLMEGDFLKFDLRGHFPEGVNVVGNFPYNISSQIFFRVLENRDMVPEVAGMVQREVAQRIAEPPGSRTYGILSVLLQAWYDIEYLFTVSEGVFSPPPKVKSAVVRLTRNGVRELGCDEALFVRVVKAAFGQRRKMLRNSLRAALGDFGGAEHPLFADRAERLSVAQFVELTNWVEAHM